MCKVIPDLAYYCLFSILPTSNTILYSFIIRLTTSLSVYTIIWSFPLTYSFVFHSLVGYCVTALSLYTLSLLISVLGENWTEMTMTGSLLMKVAHELNLQHKRNVSKIPRDCKRKEMLVLSCRLLGIREDSEQATLGWVLKMRKGRLHWASHKAEARTRHWPNIAHNLHRLHHFAEFSLTLSWETHGYQSLQTWKSATWLRYPHIPKTILKLQLPNSWINWFSGKYRKKMLKFYLTRWFIRVSVKWQYDWLKL